MEENGSQDDLQFVGAEALGFSLYIYLRGSSNGMMNRAADSKNPIC